MIVLNLIVCLAASPSPDAPFMSAELIFPPQKLHNHGSCIVECPNGDLLVSWYNGSGERSADDVKILGARFRNGKWSAAFVMADTPGFPDCNSCMVIDPNRRLWLFWPLILDNHWESALTLCKVSSDYQKPGSPKWTTEKTLFLKPGPEFQVAVEKNLDSQWAPTMRAANPEQKDRLKTFLAAKKEMAADKLKTRLGWMPRAHPFILDSDSPSPRIGRGGQGVRARLILPLYSDGFDFSIMAITDNWGATWFTSEPLVGPGNVQPSIAKRKDGTLVAFFRDNGPPPQRVMVSESKDRGMTWSLSRDIDLPNPGSGLEVLGLKSGRWLLIYNDTERGRHSLAVSLSEDEGRTWRITRHLEHDSPGPDAGSYSYPSVIQARDGTLHATYSYRGNRENNQRHGEGESIKHVHFTESWILGR